MLKPFRFLEETRKKLLAAKKSKELEELDKKLEELYSLDVEDVVRALPHARCSVHVHSVAHRRESCSDCR